jgi:hypothetical protein
MSSKQNVPLPVMHLVPVGLRYVTLEVWFKYFWIMAYYLKYRLPYLQLDWEFYRLEYQSFAMLFFESHPLCYFSANGLYDHPYPMYLVYRPKKIEYHITTLISSSRWGG